MTRIIKFRAWDKKNGMVSNPAFQVPSAGQVGLNDLCVIVPNLMQFTGLLDKNGKEIYEGDIVKYMYLNTSPVEERKSEVKLMGIGDVNRNIQAYYPFCYSVSGNYREENREVTECFLTPADKSEIIGNIYENPELLK